MTTPDTDLEYFSSIPWCLDHLNQPDTIKRGALTWKPENSGQNALLARTLRTPNTIPAFLAVYKPPQHHESNVIREMTYLIHLETGLAGHPGLCHGGIISTILDEVLGVTLIMNRIHKTALSGLHLTGQLNVKFTKPIPLPGTYVCRSRITNIEGKKRFIEGTIEDQNGVVLACGESLFINVKEKL